MGKTNTSVVLAAMLLASCSKESKPTERLEKTNGEAAEMQKAIEDAELKQPHSIEVEKELRQLEGAWNEVATERDGKRKETRPDDDFMSILIFKGDVRTDRTKGDIADKLSQSGKIRIDPKKIPKRLEFFISGAKQPEKEVYELHGDELKICSILGSNSFPSEITGKKPQHLLVIYKRVKK